MLLTVNGVSLHSSSIGWRLLAKSVVRAGSRYAVVESEMPGRDGVTLSGRTRDASLLRLRVLTPAAQWEALQAHFAAEEIVVTTDAGWRAEGKTILATEQEQDQDTSKLIGTFDIRVPAGCWRGDVATSALAAAISGGVSLSVFAGLSAPVQDAIVRLKGPLEAPQVVDTSGAFLVLDGDLSADQYLRFEADTGRAWLTGSDTWTGGDEVSGLVDFGGPRDVFEITPRFTTPGNPTLRDGRLTLTYDSFGGGAGFQVRGRPSFLM